MCEEMNVMEMINDKNSAIEYLKTTGFFGGFMAPIIHPPYGSLGSEVYAFESARHPICSMCNTGLQRFRLPNEIIEDIQARLTTREYRYLVETRVGSSKEEIVKFRDILTKLIDAGVFDPVEGLSPAQFVSYPWENNKGNYCVSTNETTETTKQEETVDTNGVDERLKTWAYVEPTDADKECDHSCDCKKECNHSCDCKNDSNSESTTEEERIDLDNLTIEFEISDPKYYSEPWDDVVRIMPLSGVEAMTDDTNVTIVVTPANKTVRNDIIGWLTAVLDFCDETESMPINISVNSAHLNRRMIIEIREAIESNFINSCKVTEEPGKTLWINVAHDVDVALGVITSAMFTMLKYCPRVIM